MTIRNRQDSETLETQILAPYAAKSAESRGRCYAEASHDYRTHYQRDRDRVIHSRAFRRLEYKTQVFVNHEGDYYRTRLTHSLEVAQIARTIARALRLNEDLAEAICLAHDLGHTPFGHSGETAMNELMKSAGGFEHNRQSFRVVTFLEDRYPDFLGLNLTHEVLEGLTKHSQDYFFADGRTFEKSGAPTLEAQLCDFADEIAYNNHDIDDGIKSGMLSVELLNDVALWNEQFEKVRRELNGKPARTQVLYTIRALINAQVTDLINHTVATINARGIQSFDDLKQNGLKLANFSDEMRRKNTELKRFLFKYLYQHYRVERMAVKAGRIIRDLFRAYVANPRILPPQFFERVEKDGIEVVVCDYIAGMTDRYALTEYKKLFDPFERV